MKFFVALLLTFAATAATLPDAIGTHQRTGTASPQLQDRQIWDEYGLKIAESGTFSLEKGTFSVEIYRFQDPTGAFGKQI